MTFEEVLDQAIAMLQREVFWCLRQLAGTPRSFDAWRRGALTAAQP
jgi:hypothetical protein